MASFFAPRTVAVVGANRERGKIGAEVLHNLRAGGFTGRLFAVHPCETEIDGVPAHQHVADIGGEVDLAVICVPAAAVLDVADQCIAKGVKALVVISAGFSETGAEGRAREAALLERVRRAGVRLVGPNCMGIINTDPAVRLNATFAPNGPPSGRVSMSTQSGALGLAILDYARTLDIGLSTFVSVGNKADVSSNDLLQYWAQDPRTDVILLYLESFGNPRRFSQIARRVSRRKPIVAVKSGRSASGARAAASHTGALASSDAVVDALFAQAGVIRTTTIQELFDVATLLAHQPVPLGRRVAILTNAGGPGILAADACEGHGLELTPLSPACQEALRSFLPRAAAVANPVDMLASASAADYEQALRVLLTDDEIDSVLAIFIPPLVTDADDVAHAIHSAATAQPHKTIAAVFMSAAGTPPGLAPIPSFTFPESAAAALAHAARRGEWLRSPAASAPSFVDFDRHAARAIVDRVLNRGGGWLAPADAQALLSASGIPTVRAAVVTSEADALEAAIRIGYPIALKVVGPDILHKTELGGVLLDLRTPEAVVSAWRDLSTRVGDRMTGALVQEMVSGGIELLVGATEDPTFGPVIACAMGGTLAELLHDASFRLQPLTSADASSMIDELKGARLLRGYRGAPPADEASVRDCLLRVSALLDVCPEILELDINPLRVLTAGVRALDVRIRVERLRPRPPTRRISY
jgi:acetyl coenzyme A synthetase (ADP forming)-like protein